MDSCIEDFSVKRKTNRYPLVVFFNILDIAVFNSYVIAKEGDIISTRKCRRDYMKSLAFSLARENMMIRMNNDKVYGQVKESFRRFGLEREPQIQPPRNLPNTPKQCAHDQCRRKTRSTCDICQKRV